MTSLRHVWAVSFLALAAVLFAAAPSSASAYTYYNNHHDYGTLSVRVQVDNDYCGNSHTNHYPYYSNCANDYRNGAYDRDPSDFVVAISGNYPSKNYFRGSSSITEVDMMRGAYSVSVVNLFGYRVEYSAGCSGYIEQKDTPSCTITLTPPYYYGSYNDGYYPQTPYSYPTYSYAPAATVVSYLPSLPNTGFAPLDAATLTLALVLLLGAGIFAYPYVRKTALTILG